VRTRDYLYLAPDNGLLSWRLERDPAVSVYSVENPRYVLNPVSRTFHGRDIFAPVAARLTVGVLPEALGPAVPPGDIVRIEFPKPVRADARTLRGEIIYVDRFGDCISNIGADDLAEIDESRVKVEIASLSLSGLGRSYADTSRGTALALIGSAGFLEIAASGASAAKNFGLKVGDPVLLKLP
jgi:S-adenosylmethionine hydrolase